MIIFYKDIPPLQDMIKPYYMIGTNGSVFSKISNKFLTPQVTENGYLTVHLQTENGDVIRKIHRLEMMTFMYFKGCEKFEVNHINGNKFNNYWYNLEWSTAKENIRHAINTNLRQSYIGECNPKCKITEEMAFHIGEMLKAGYTDSEIMNILNIPNMSIITEIAKGKTWTYLFSNDDLKEFRKTRKGYHLTRDQYHQICLFYQSNSYLYKGHGSKTKLINDALNSLGIENNMTNFRIAKRLYYRHEKPEICNLYSY